MTYAPAIGAFLGAVALSGCATVSSGSALTEWDAVSAAPASHEVLLENEKVRVLRVTVAAGATEPIHSHGWSSVMYFEQPQPITYIAYELIDGTPVEVNREEAPAMPANLTVSTGPEGLHAVQNHGPAPFVALRVEFKDGTVFGD